MSLFATKPLDQLVKEAQETGEHSLRRTLGAFQLTALGVDYEGKLTREPWANFRLRVLLPAQECIITFCPR